MGANTYRLMSRLAADGEPGTDALAGLSKVVFSTTLTEPLAWANTQLVSQDPVESVRKMKSTGAASMRTIGSLMLGRSLLTAGLVDRFRVVVFPVITGSTGRDRKKARWRVVDRAMNDQIGAAIRSYRMTTHQRREP